MIWPSNKSFPKILTIKAVGTTATKKTSNITIGEMIRPRSFKGASAFGYKRVNPKQLIKPMCISIQ